MARKSSEVAWLGAEMELFDADAVPVISAYLAAVQAPWALAAFPVGPDSSAAEIAAQLDSMAVLRLVSETSVA
ncbi:hypothetical protein [Amycolatopsis circi]|uniref:hypothetical protein n=1 Tax=Amycolatopsis circi TaxID=871959 RepID=UPI0013BEA3E1|nr:hypothetical protein [Amycolatopsis circi]